MIFEIYLFKYMKLVSLNTITHSSGNSLNVAQKQFFIHVGSWINTVTVQLNFSNFNLLRNLLQM